MMKAPAAEVAGALSSGGVAEAWDSYCDAGPDRAPTIIFFDSR
jgi:hypothetical protein